jgi:hypothetical protein
MFNRESQPPTQPEPRPSQLEATSAKIAGIKDGETLEFSDVDGGMFNVLNDRFKPQRKEGKISFDFNQDAKELKVMENTAPEPAPEPPPQPYNKETL